jgi:hypothetical protein
VCTKFVLIFGDDMNRHVSAKVSEGREANKKAKAPKPARVRTYLLNKPKGCFIIARLPVLIILYTAMFNSNTRL